MQSTSTYSYDTNGNVASVSKSGTAATTATTTYQRNSFGEIIQIKDPMQVSGAHSGQTTMSYGDPGINGCPSSSSANLGLPTTVTDALGHTTKTAYWKDTGLAACSSDANGKVTQYQYDVLGRVKQVTAPDQGVATYSIFDGAPSSVTTVNPIGVTSKSVQDGYGRTSQTSLTGTSGGTDYVDTLYDPLGRVASVSNPYQATTEPTYGITSYKYDALGRKTLQMQPDNSTSNKSILYWCYDGVSSPEAQQTNCSPNKSSKIGSWVDASDEVGNHTQQVSDSVGRLTAVVEPNPTSGALALETDYQYDALNNLAQVDQWGGPSGTAGNRQRSFSYDGFGRLNSSMNPESSLLCYGVWSVGSVGKGTCQNGYDGNGNLIYKTDARGVITNYSYDTLNRLLQKAYTIPSVAGVPVATPTPSVAYTFDTTTQTGAANTLGRLTSETVQQGSSVLFQRVIPNYDEVGRIATELRCVASFCGSYLQDTEYTYDHAGNELTSNTNETLISYGYDGRGRLNYETLQYTGQTAGTLIYNIQYSPLGGITGTDNFESRTYDNRGRTTKVNYNSTALGLSYNAAYDYYPNGNTHHESDNVIGNFAYNYDSLNRLTSAVSQDPKVGTQAYTYDNFGNRLSQTGVLAHNATFSDGTNRIDCSPGCYDASGNLLQDVNTAFAPHSYSYDAEGRLSGVTDLGYQYFYDGEGTRVLALQNNAIQRQYFWDAHGQYYYVYKADNGWSSMEFFGAGRHIFNFSTADYLPVLNALGTERSRMGFGNNYGSNGYYQNCGSLPFGDGLQCSNVDVSPLHFTGKERDAESSLDNFGARYYASNIGRFMSPDYNGSGETSEPVPYADFNSPQSLNLYSYVGNNPLSQLDADGHYHCDADRTTTGSDGSITVTAGACHLDFSDFVQFFRAITRQDAKQITTGIGEYVQSALDSTKNCPNCQVGVVPFGMTGGLSLELKPIAEGAELQKIIDQLYKPTDAVLGGTAGAVRQEVASGAEVGGKLHTQKALERAAQLEKGIASGKFSGRDEQLARTIAQDLRNAVAG